MCLHHLVATELQSDVTINCTVRRTKRMKRHYTLFIATPELLSCPDIYQHAKAHNLILTPNTSRTVSVVTPLEQPPGDLRETEVDFDPHMVSVNSIDLMYENGLLYITFAIKAVDVGVSDISLTIPSAETAPVSVLRAVIS